MGLFILGLLAMAFCGEDTNNKKNRKKAYRRRYRKNNDWLDAAWFHDHGQNI